MTIERFVMLAQIRLVFLSNEDAYGDTEDLLCNLTDELSLRGHRENDAGCVPFTDEVYGPMFDGVPDDDLLKLRTDVTGFRDYLIAVGESY